MPAIEQFARDAAGFRLRGAQVTRPETFVDAAFAFSLTLLVIFTNDLPQSAEELRQAFKRVPTLVACFAVLMMFWAAHNRWSRRFGMLGPTRLLGGLPMWCYATLGFWMPWYHVRRERQRQALSGHGEAGGA